MSALEPAAPPAVSVTEPEPGTPPPPVSDARSPPTSPVTSRGPLAAPDVASKVQTPESDWPAPIARQPSFSHPPPTALTARTPSKASFPRPSLSTASGTPGGGDAPPMSAGAGFKRVPTLPTTIADNRDHFEALFGPFDPEIRPRRDYATQGFETRVERELERRERELDRRERELERRERELERRQREFEQDKARYSSELASVPIWQTAMGDLERRLTSTWEKALKKKEEEWEKKVMSNVAQALEKERQVYGLMRMSDVEVSEMVEDTVGYLMQKDEDIADRVRLQSLLYLAQEKLASQAGLEPDPKSGSLAVSWRLALGPSIITEDRYQKAIELLKDKPLDESTVKVTETKKAMDYAVEYTSHLRKEAEGGNDMTHFTAGRISRTAYLESVQRQVSTGSYDLEGLMALVDLVCPETPVFQQ